MLWNDLDVGNNLPEKLQEVNITHINYCPVSIRHNQLISAPGWEWAIQLGLVQSATLINFDPIVLALMQIYCSLWVFTAKNSANSFPVIRRHFLRWMSSPYCATPPSTPSYCSFWRQTAVYVFPLGGLRGGGGLLLQATSVTKGYFQWVHWHSSTEEAWKISDRPIS